MESIGNVSLIISVLSLVISIVILIRWWRMTSDVRDIRDLLFKSDSKETQPGEDYSGLDEAMQKVREDDADIEKLKLKLKPDQCIIRVLANSRLEIWDKSTWDEHVEQGKGKFFEFIFKNY